MSEIRERYARVAAGFGSLVQNVPSGAWDAQSPCEDWKAFDVAAHVIMVTRAALAGLDGRDATAPEKGEDLTKAWDDAMNGVVDAMDGPERTQTTKKGMFGEQPFEQIVGGILTADTLIHTWDLARATDQDDTLDGPAVEKALAMLTSFGDQMRGTGSFGPEIPTAPDADPQTKLLHFAGRQT